MNFVKSAMSNVVTVRSNKSLCMALLVLLAWYLWLVYSKNISQLHYITTVNESVLFNFNLCRALYVACLLGYMFFPSINYGAYFFGAPLLMTSLVKFQYFVFLLLIKGRHLFICLLDSAWFYGAFLTGSSWAKIFMICLIFISLTWHPSIFVYPYNFLEIIKYDLPFCIQNRVLRDCSRV